MSTLQEKCPTGHELSRSACDSYLICDSCGIEIDPGIETHSCKECSYDVCLQCMAAIETKATFIVSMMDGQKAAIDLNIIGPSAACVAELKGRLRELGLAGEEDFQLFLEERCLWPDGEYLCNFGLREVGTEVKITEAEACAVGHKLAWNLAAQDGYICDSCGTTVNTGGELHSCRQCDYDFCGTCSHAKDAHKVATFNVTMLSGASASMKLYVTGPKAERVAELKCAARKGLGLDPGSYFQLFVGEQRLHPNDQYLCKFGLRGGTAIEVAIVTPSVISIKQHMYGNVMARGGKSDGKRSKGNMQSYLSTTLDLELQPGVLLKDQTDNLPQIRGSKGYSKGKAHDRLIIYKGQDSPPKFFSDLASGMTIGLTIDDYNRTPEDVFADGQWSLVVRPPPQMYGKD